MRLIVSEKPSVAYAIGAALGVGKKQKGYLEGKAWKHQVMLYSNKVMRIPFLPAHGCIILLQG